MADWVTTPSGIKYLDYRHSDGAPVKTGDLITIHYRLAIGNENTNPYQWIENTWETKQPIKFRLGIGEILKGLDEAIPGMRIACERRIVVPHKLAYGERGVANRIPPNSSLVFEIYIVNIEEA